MLTLDGILPRTDGLLEETLVWEVDSREEAPVWEVDSKEEAPVWEVEDSREET